jgi:hypothetical protein
MRQLAGYLAKPPLELELVTGSIPADLAANKIIPRLRQFRKDDDVVDISADVFNAFVADQSLQCWPSILIVCDDDHPLAQAGKRNNPDALSMVAR